MTGLPREFKPISEINLTEGKYYDILWGTGDSLILTRGTEFKQGRFKCRLADGIARVIDVEEVLEARTSVYKFFSKD